MFYIIRVFLAIFEGYLLVMLIFVLKQSPFFPMQLTAANDDNYFVFEDTILQVKKTNNK